MRALIVVLALIVSWPAHAQQWRDPDLGAHIRQGFATRDTIWLFGGDTVVRFVRQTGEREVVARDVVDMLPDRDRLWVLIRNTDNTASYVLRDLRTAAEPSVEEVAARLRLYLHPSETSEGDVIGLFAWPGQDRPAVLARRAVVAPTSEGWTRWGVAATLGPGGRMATPDGRSVYIGYARGEWGGGLRQVAVASGSVSFVTQAGDGLCGGLINPRCDSVVGVVPDRQNPDCVITAIGSSHFRDSDGDVFRVCGSEISMVFALPRSPEQTGSELNQQTLPLSNLTATSDGWIGVRRDRYFRARGERVGSRPTPPLRDWSGLKISDEEDGVLFVMSACCWGSALDPTLHHMLALPVSP